MILIGCLFFIIKIDVIDRLFSNLSIEVDKVEVEIVFGE